MRRTQTRRLTKTKPWCVWDGIEVACIEACGRLSLQGDHEFKYKYRSRLVPKNSNKYRVRLVSKYPHTSTEVALRCLVSEYSNAITEALKHTFQPQCA
jgi:hypothetical protein